MKQGQTGEGVTCRILVRLNASVNFRVRTFYYHFVDEITQLMQRRVEIDFDIIVRKGQDV